VIFYRCKCGRCESYGSMPPYACQRCSLCKSNFASHPSLHADPKPHEFFSESVETNDGPATIDRCRFCMRTRREIAEEISHESLR
jgi:hypothetical protein